MFDAKKLLEMMMQGAQPQQAPAGAGATGGLADLLGRVLQGAQSPQQSGRSQLNSEQGGSLADILGKLGQQQGGQAGGQAGSGAPSGGGSLGDLLGKVLGGGQQPTTPAPSPQAQAQPQAPTGAPGGGLEDILRKLQEQIGGAGGAGSLGDILGQVFGQAKTGVSEGARRIDDATGASGHVRAATQSATGQDPAEILNQIKDWVSKNQGGAGAAAGGLGAVVLGTHAGRALAGKAFKLGSLALIGGLAYKALQNYQAGKPLISGADVASLTEAPRGTGYETAAVTHDSAQLYIRAMIAAAAADGRIDETEQQKIFASLKQAGIDQGAEEFIAKELNSPATVEDLVAGVTSEQEAVQVFTAARVAIDLDTQEENDFLIALANGLGIDGKLAQHIDAAARGAA